MPRLEGKRCLIIGGTGGIGQATSRLFLTEGARVVISGLPSAHGSSTPAGSPDHPAAACVPCDATIPTQVAELFARTRALLGGLDVLFHVAGISGRRLGDGPLHECTDEGWQGTLRANLTSVFLTNREAVRLFREQGHGGVILNMGSALALAPGPEHFNTTAYTAAKGAIISMSRLAAATYAAEGIRVNALAPGLVDTPMAARAMGDPTVQAYVRQRQPLSRGACTPEDVAAAAAYLCSDEARHLTGVVLPVDGGWCLGPGSAGE